MRRFDIFAAARVARRLVICALASALALPAAAQNFTPREENPEDYPAGAGREDTFYACTACHGFKLVAAQGMNRRQWEDTLALMNQRHGMPALDAKDREVVLNYLEATFPPVARGGWQNPFLNR
jgi:hypothetical protein